MGPCTPDTPPPPPPPRHMCSTLLDDSDRWQISTTGGPAVWTTRMPQVLMPSSSSSSRHHTVTRGITKGVKEDFRLAMERQVSRCGENLLTVLHRFCINEKIILVQSLPWLHVPRPPDLWPLILLTKRLSWIADSLDLTEIWLKLNFAHSLTVSVLALWSTIWGVLPLLLGPPLNEFKEDGPNCVALASVVGDRTFSVNKVELVDVSNLVSCNRADQRQGSPVEFIFI